MGKAHVLWILLLACAVAGAQQTSDSGLTPKAGAVSENLYTNLFFGFNFRLPQQWSLAFVASEGACAPECMLLDVRGPGYPKPPRSITISAENGAAATRADHLASAALVLEQSGARKLGTREFQAASHKFSRTDYRSELVNAELYQAFIAMTSKDYLLVFTYAAESRKQLDAMVDELTKNLSFVGAKSTSP